MPTPPSSITSSTDDYVSCNNTLNSLNDQTSVSDISFNVSSIGSDVDGDNVSTTLHDDDFNSSLDGQGDEEEDEELKLFNNKKFSPIKTTEDANSRTRFTHNISQPDGEGSLVFLDESSQRTVGGTTTQVVSMDLSESGAPDPSTEVNRSPVDVSSTEIDAKADQSADDGFDSDGELLDLANLPDTVSVLNMENGKTVYLVGTSHFSKESHRDVRKVM